MGTAGPLALARSILDDGQGTPFFVLNRSVSGRKSGRDSSSPKRD